MSPGCDVTRVDVEVVCEMHGSGTVRWFRAGSGKSQISEIRIRKDKPQTQNVLTRARKSGVGNYPELRAGNVICLAGTC